ncbi:MAG: GNAT family N-acetyltransferase [Pseudomonadota bacterium]
MKLRAVTGAALDAALQDLAALRIAVFRDWPYLYDGDLAYERRYLASYRDNPRAVVVVAEDAGQVVGAATGMPLADHADARALTGAMPEMQQVFYCAESVLLPRYRGQGLGHGFFDLREAHARALGARYAAFCGVLRPDDHPERPPAYRPLDPFWRKRGYAPVPGVTAQFSWRDIGDADETAKTLQFWMRRL